MPVNNAWQAPPETVRPAPTAEEPAPGVRRMPERRVARPKRPGPYPPPGFGDFPPDGQRTDPNGALYRSPLHPGRPEDLPGPEAAEPAVAEQDAVALPAEEHAVRVVTPVPPPQPEARERDPRRPWLVGVAALAGIVLAATVVMLIQVGMRAGQAPPPVAASGPVPDAPTAGSGPAAPATTGFAAPRNVRLRDNRDSVTLQWEYPDGGEGPVLISGGRAGQPQKVFQPLAAGTTDYILYGLNESLNYCFTVSIAYTADRPVSAEPVCTSR